MLHTSVSNLGKNVEMKINFMMHLFLGKSFSKSGHQNVVDHIRSSIQHIVKLVASFEANRC